MKTLLDVRVVVAAVALAADGVYGDGSSSVTLQP